MAELTRLGSLMGMSARRSQRRYSGGGMPWWQQAVLMEFARPLVSGVAGFAGEGAKQLFLGKHAQGLMEGQRGMDIIDRINDHKRILKRLDAKEKYMTGNEKNIYAGQLANYKAPLLEKFIEEHGALTDGNNQELWNNLWETSKPEIQNVVDEDVREFQELRNKYRRLPTSLEELNRRAEASDGWWSKSSGGKFFTRVKNFFTGESTDDQIKRATQGLLLGPDYINFVNTKSTELTPEQRQALPEAERLAYDEDQRHKTRWKDFIGGEMQRKDLNTIWTGSFLESDTAIRDLAYKALKDENLTRFDKSRARKALERADFTLFRRVVKNEIDNAVQNKPAYYDFLLEVQMGDDGEISSHLKQLPSSDRLPTSEGRSAFMLDILRNKYHKKIIGKIVTNLPDNTLAAVQPNTLAHVKSTVNNIYNPYQTEVGLMTFKEARGLGEDGTYKGIPLSQAEMAKDPTKFKDIQATMGNKVTEIITTVGQNFVDDFATVIEKHRLNGTEVPLMRESELKDFFAEYVNNQLSNNIGLKTGEFTDPSSGVTTSVATVDVLDSENGVKFLSDRINTSEVPAAAAADGAPAANGKPATPGGKDVELALLKEEQVRNKGFMASSLNSQQLNTFNKELEDITNNQLLPILEANSNIEGLNDASQVIADYFIEQKDKYQFIGFNTVTYTKAGKMREKLAATYGITETPEDSFRMMQNLLAPKSAEVPLLERDFKGTAEEYYAVRDLVLSKNPNFEGARLNLEISTTMGTNAYVAARRAIENSPAIDSVPPPDKAVNTTEKFDPEGDGYDYATAKAHGITADETGHWPSRSDKDGQILKGVNHETYHKTVAAEKEAGYEIIRNPENGRYYSFPINIKDDALEKSDDSLLSPKTQNGDALEKSDDSLLSPNDETEDVTDTEALKREREQAIINLYRKKQQEAAELQAATRAWLKLSREERLEYKGIKNFIAARREAS